MASEPERSARQSVTRVDRRVLSEQPPSSPLWREPLLIPGSAASWPIGERLTFAGCVQTMASWKSR